MLSLPQKVNFPKMKAAALLASAMLFSSSILADSLPAARRIVVVGGGVGGLSTVDRLTEALPQEIQSGAVEVRLYTDAPRAGGRVWSETINLPNGEKLVMNRGAELIDSGHEHMIGFAKKLGVELMDTHSKEPLNSGTYYYNGKPMTEAAMHQRILSNPEPLKVLAQHQAALDAARAAKDTMTAAPNTVGIERQLDNMGLHDYLKSLKLDPFQITYLESVTSETGVSEKKLNALALFDYFKFDPEGKKPPEFLYANDEAYRVRGGTQKITDGLYERHKGMIQTGERLVAIESSDNITYKLTFASPTGKRVVLADQVVLAVPFNQMKDVAINVKGMPQQAVMAAQKTTYGKHTKLVLFFDERVWQTKYKDAGDGLGKGFQLWDSSQGQPGKAGSLTFYLGDRDKPVSKREVKKFLALLEKKYPGISKHYLTYDFQNWTHSYTGGPAVGEKTAVKAEMSRLTKGLYVAHEGVDGQAYGYMEGAARAGTRAADQIAAEEKAVKAMQYRMPNMVPAAQCERAFAGI